MATLTVGQMAFYAQSVGLPNPRLMGAIGMAESSGRTDVVNAIGCVGLWQINQPVHVKSHPQWTVAWLKSPLNNARAAKSIYDSQGLSAWEAYTNGSYKKYYDGAEVEEAGDDPCSALKGTPAYDMCRGKKHGPSLGDTASQLAKMANAVVKAGDWLSNPHNWLRIVYVTGGGLLVVAGLQMVVQGKSLQRLAPVLGGTVGSKAKIIGRAASARPPGRRDGQ